MVVKIKIFDNNYAFFCFSKKILRRMPFLPQPSPFIRAWDRHQKTQKYASDGWICSKNVDGKVEGRSKRATLCIRRPRESL